MREREARVSECATPLASAGRRGPGLSSLLGHGHLAHLSSAVRRGSYPSRGAWLFAMHPSCCCFCTPTSPPRTPALGPDAAYSSTQHALDVGAVRRESTGTSAWPSGPRAPRLRPHDSMSCSRRGAHRTPPVELISPRPFPVPGGVGVGGAGPRGRFRWKASQPAAGG